MTIFDDELVYATFLKRDVERRRQELDELWSAYPNRRQGLGPFTITSVGTAAPSPAPVTSINSTASSAAPPSPPLSASTSIDTNSLISTTTEPLEPVQASPARCSTEGHSHNEQAQVLVAAAPTSASTIAVQGAEEDTFTTAPTKCSTDCGSQDKIALPPGTAVLRTEEDFHKEPPTFVQAHVELHQRYISNYTYADSSDAVLPCLATRVGDVERVFEKKSEQYSVVLWPPFTSAVDWMLSKPSWPPPIQNRWEGIFLLNPVLLQPLLVTIVDRGPEPSIMSVEIADMLPKPPWPVIPLRANSLMSNVDLQLCFSFCMWFNCDGVTMRHRPIPWPSFTSHTLELCSPVIQSIVTPPLDVFELALRFSCSESKSVFKCGISHMQVMLSYSISVLPSHNGQLQKQLLIINVDPLFNAKPDCLLGIVQATEPLMEVSSVTSQMAMRMNDDQLRAILEPAFYHHEVSSLELSALQTGTKATHYWAESILIVVQWLTSVSVGCDGALLLNKDQVQKQLPITKAEQLSTTTLGSSHEAIKGHISTLDIFVQLHNDCDYFMAVKGEISLLLLLIHSTTKYTTTCEFNMQCCKQHSESLENAVRVAGSWQSFQGTIIGALALSTLIQKPWQLLYIYRSTVVFQLSVSHQVVCCKECSPPILVCMADNGITRTTVLFNRQVLLHCYQYKVQDVLQWSAYEDAVTYVHVASIRIPPSQAGTFVGHYFWLTQICTSPWCAWCNEKVIQREDHRTAPMLKLSTSRADIAQFFRLYSKFALHDWAKIQVASHWLACTACQIKSSWEKNLSQLTSTVNISTIAESAWQLKRDGTAPLVMASPMVTFYKPILSAKNEESSEQAVDSSFDKCCTCFREVQVSPVQGSEIYQISVGPLLLAQEVNLHKMSCMAECMLHITLPFAQRWTYIHFRGDIMDQPSTVRHVMNQWEHISSVTIRAMMFWFTISKQIQKSVSKDCMAALVEVQIKSRPPSLKPNSDSGTGVAQLNIHFLLLGDVDLLFVHDASNGLRPICLKAQQGVFLGSDYRLRIAKNSSKAILMVFSLELLSACEILAIKMVVILTASALINDTEKIQRSKYVLNGQSIFHKLKNQGAELLWVMRGAQAYLQIVSEIEESRRRAVMGSKLGLQHKQIRVINYSRQPPRIVMFYQEAVEDPLKPTIFSKLFIYSEV